MKSCRLDIFFSCSFQDEDKAINEHFLAICKAVDLKPTNVDGAYSTVPLDVARDLMAESQGLIAIAARRKEIEPNIYETSPSVKEEIILAYGSNTPILIFKEKGVRLEGMMSSLVTPLEYDREDLLNPDAIEKSIRSIHDFKMKMIGPNDLVYEHDPSEVLAEHASQLIELKDTERGLVWCYTTTKRLQFLTAFRKHIPVTFWAIVPTQTEDATTPIQIEINVHGSSDNMGFEVEPVKQTPSNVKSLIKLIPNPRKGDFLEYSAHSESRYFNPVYKGDIVEDAGLEIEGMNYSCIDGFVFIQRTKTASVELRFPRGFPIKKGDIVPFAGGYTDEVDFLEEGEMERLDVEIVERGGVVEAKMSIDWPLLRHMYGFAWNPPEKAE